MYSHNYSKRSLFILNNQKEKKNETGKVHKAGHTLNFWEIFEHRCELIRNE